MKRSEKEALVAELKGKVAGATAVYYTDFTGLNVKRMTELRRRLRREGIEYVVIKNTLALRAAKEAGLVSEKLRGPTGIVVAPDAITAAKVLTDFAKENDQLVDAATVTRLAAIPPRDTLLAMIAGAFQAPLGSMLGALEALKAQREGAASA
jgi:large subunit ribosomal protein L10